MCSPLAVTVCLAGTGLRQQAGEFLGQGLVFGEEFLQLQAQGGQGIFVVGMGGGVLSGFQRGGSGFYLGAQFLPQGFGVVETLFTGLFAEFFGRFLPGEFDAFEQVRQEGGEELDELGGELKGPWEAPFTGANRQRMIHE